MNADYGIIEQTSSFISNGPIVTMDSREIAELTGKHHKHVLVDIDSMLVRLGIQPAGFSARYVDGKGETRRCYKLPFRETMILVSGYSVELRTHVVDRWIELEKSGATPALPDFTNPAAAARAWADQYEQVQHLQPLAKVAERIASAVGLRTISEVGKINGIGPRKLFDVLRDRSIIFRCRGEWVPYQDYIDSGYFVVKEQPYEDSEGIPRLRKQIYVTGKGETWIAKRLFVDERTRSPA